jgi:hypothetical protein
MNACATHVFESHILAGIRLRKIRWMTILFIVGLFLCGVTAIPLQTELDLLVKWLQPEPAQSPTGLSYWLLTVRAALADNSASHPFLFYGTDWLAFGHFMIALVFVGALRNPVRNRWLFDFGLIACATLIPYAFIFGAIRGIPVWWRLIDCSFGVFGAIPLWFCRKWTLQIESQSGGSA